MEINMKKIILSIIILSISFSAVSQITFNISIPQPDFISNDWDNDGDPNSTDPDDDNDGINDEDDSNPFNISGQSSYSNTAPIAVISVVSNIDQVITFKISDSYDENGDNLTYTVNYGDGDEQSYSDNSNKTKSYSTLGDRNITLIVTDENGGTTSETITVSPNAPEWVYGGESIYNSWTAYDYHVSTGWTDKSNLQDRGVSPYTGKNGMPLNQTSTSSNGYLYQRGDLYKTDNHVNGTFKHYRIYRKKIIN
jgi:hypothetical protein